MEVEEKEGVLAVGGRNRRVHARSIVDELAQIFLMDRGSTMNVTWWISAWWVQAAHKGDLCAGPRVCVEVTFR